MVNCPNLTITLCAQVQTGEQNVYQTNAAMLATSEQGMIPAMVDQITYITIKCDKIMIIEIHSFDKCWYIEAGHTFSLLH